MPEPPERLFRDDVGAALERVARLEDENQQLREEIARFHEPRPSRATPGPRPGIAMGLTIAAVVTGGALFSKARHDHRPPGYVPHYHTSNASNAPPRAVTPVPTPVAAATVTAPVADQDDCSVPYWHDENGVKHYKMNCIHPIPTARAPR